jgi:putative tricarboxylic transport membrane protein
MDPLTDAAPRRSDRGEVAISVGLIVLAIVVVVQSFAISGEGGYSAIGPRFSPLLVAVGLAVIGALLLREALRGGWRAMEGAVPAERFEPMPFAWIAGGLLVHMAIIGVVGFTVASTLLFASVARGMGSRRALRDLIIGAVFAAIIFLLFTRVLNLSLPPLVRGVI